MACITPCLGKVCLTPEMGIGVLAHISGLHLVITRQKLRPRLRKLAWWFSSFIYIAVYSRKIPESIINQPFVKIPGINLILKLLFFIWEILKQNIFLLVVSPICENIGTNFILKLLFYLRIFKAEHWLTGSKYLYSHTKS